MDSRAVRGAADTGDRSPTRGFGWLALLVVTSLVLQRLTAPVVRWVADRPPWELDPQLLGAVVYAAGGMVALTAVYAAVRARRGQTMQRHELVQAAGTAAMLLLVVAYVLHGATDLPAFPVQTVSALLAAAATGGSALAYAALLGRDVRVGLPDREAGPTTAAAVLVAACAAVGQLVAFRRFADPVLLLAPGTPLGPDLTAAVLAWEVAVPSILVGTGMALLYCAVVQETLRERVDPAAAVGAVTVLVGVTFQHVAVAGPRRPAVTAATAAAVALVGLLAAGVAALGVRRLPRTLDGRSLAAAAVGLIVVPVAVGGLVAVTRPLAGVASTGTLTFGVAPAAAAAAAAVGYDRTRSAWVPALAFAAYLALVDGDLAVHLLALLQ